LRSTESRSAEAFPSGNDDLGAAMTSDAAAGGAACCLPRTVYGSRPIGPALNALASGEGSFRSVGLLNARDVELLRHLAAGRSTAQTAAAMSLTTNTVRTRIRRVEAKLAVTGRQEIVRAAQEHGIV
jgi:DNA-binding CsgD family transcriptional regulator